MSLLSEPIPEADAPSLAHDSKTALCSPMGTTTQETRDAMARQPCESVGKTLAC